MGTCFIVEIVCCIIFVPSQVKREETRDERHLLVRVSSSYAFYREFMAIDTAFHMVFRPHFVCDALNK
ncbi:hypothetical protein P5673_013517 [Acropora cervicornis]|uniref:Uncharacterized protein n=1 Tax=Acropora cervicornis TaxID=6130 RepID=A0AAD9V734_ACRCE|nr:hypothetical protein P5673_013517 [Acropora cervicornis]